MVGRMAARASLFPDSRARTSLPSIMLSRYSLWMTTLERTPPSPSWISRASRLRSSTMAISRTACESLFSSRCFIRSRSFR